MYECMYIHYGGISHSSIIETAEFCMKIGNSSNFQYSAEIISACKHQPHNQELAGEIYIRDSVDPPFISTSLDYFSWFAEAFKMKRYISKQTDEVVL